LSIPVSQLKPSLTIEYNNQPYSIIQCEHAKVARGSSFARAKIKNLITSQIIECTLRDSDKISAAFIERKKLIFSYHESNYCHFFDTDTYQDFILDKDKIEDKAVFLKENLELTGLFYKNQLINLELPLNITLEVIETEPGFKGDTKKGGTKPAKLETGIIVDVPLFVKKGDKIKVDTRTQSYLERT